MCHHHKQRRRRWTVMLGLAALALSLPLSGNHTVLALGDETEPDAATGNDQAVHVRKGNVELHVADLPLADVLRLLSLESKRNIVASPKVKGSVTANLYGVTFEEALNAILVPNGAGFRTVGNFIFVHTKDELDAINSSDATETRVFTLNYISSLDAKTYITPLLDEKDIVAVSPAPSRGLGSEATDGGGISHATQDFIVVTAKPGVLDRVAGILRQLDLRPKQVLIEATILRAELDDENALGIDFTVVGGVDLELLGATSRGITSLNLGDLPQDRFEQFNGIAQTDFAGDVPNGGITVGIVKDHVAMFVRALEQVTDTAVIANPKVLALNRQKGQVIVGRRDGYLTTTVTETQAIQTVEFLETGTQLIFRPFIGDDGFVRVELHPEDSVGFVSAQGLPSEQTTEVTTNVIVRDGETILIGGLTDKRGQVPAIGSMPIVGPLFRSKAETTTREEVIILLTINIVKDHDAYAEASHQVWENVERTRVGIREGLMWFGRERLAQTNYRKALDAVEAGDLDTALWYTKLSTHVLPRFAPALQLRERITGQREWNEDGAPSRMFIYDLIARERGYAPPNFGRPDPTTIDIGSHADAPVDADVSDGADD